MLIENNEAFLTELSKLFASNQTAGHSLYITMKRYDGRTKPHPAKHSAKGYKPRHRSSSNASDKEGHMTENRCLLRAQLGEKKISTVIAARDMNRFQMAYSNLLKGNLLGLKKKDKKKASSATGSSTKATQ